jgi:hypothetical protein
VPGAPGGSLGYANDCHVNGIPKAYLGVGLDEWGNFSNGDFLCITGGPGYSPNSIVVRGVGDGMTGYAYLTGVAAPAPLALLNVDGRPSQSGADFRRTQIDITADLKLTVRMQLGAGAPAQTVIDQYDLASLDGQGTVPPSLKIGFSGSTGSGVDYHDVRNVSIRLPDCGNGVHDPGEACDDGAKNGTFASCCNVDCTPKSNGSTCNDGNECTRTDACTNGTCGGTPFSCAAPDQCHQAGTCNGDGTCSYANKPNGSTCNDGNACTQTDACQDGSCVGADPMVCTAPDQCHEAGTCDPTTGQCLHPPKDQMRCDDGDPCTAGDTCQAGACEPGPRVACIPTPAGPIGVSGPAPAFTLDVERPPATTTGSAVVTVAGYAPIVGSLMADALRADRAADGPGHLLAVRPHGNPCSATAPPGTVQVTNCVTKTVKHRKSRVPVKLKLNKLGRKLLKQQGGLTLRIAGSVTEHRGDKSLLTALFMLLRQG